MTTITGYGAKLKAQRQEKQLSLMKVTFKAWELLPEQNRRSYGMLNRIESDDIPEDEVDLVFLAAVARVIDIPLAEVSPYASEGFGRIIDLDPRMPGGDSTVKGFTSSTRARSLRRTGPGRDRIGGTRPTEQRVA